MDFTAPLDSAALVVEVASSAYAFRAKIKASAIHLLWEKLCQYVSRTLKEQKGVLLPNLGNFLVGPVVGEARKKVRPGFKLLEGRYGSVSQERGRYVIGGRAPIVQPSYSLLSAQSGIHRGATQRIVAELLQRLGVHILSGRPVKVRFPSVGELLTNKAGRLEFVFEPLLMEHFEREHYALIKEMEPGPEDEVAHALQRQARLSSPLTAASPPQLRAVTPQQAPPLPLAGGGPHAAPMAAYPVVAAGGVRPLTAPRTPASAADLQHLHRLCKQADRIGAGTVPRAVLEGYLQREVRGLMAHFDAGTMLDLLATYSYGKARDLILYPAFLQALQAQLPSLQERAGTPLAASPAQHDAASYAGPPDTSELSFQGMLPPTAGGAAAMGAGPAGAAAPLPQHLNTSSYTSQAAPLHPFHQPQQAAAQAQAAAQVAQAQAAAQVPPPELPELWGTPYEGVAQQAGRELQAQQAVGEVQGQQQAGLLGGQAGGPAWNRLATPPTPQDVPLHYTQGQLPPRSRAEYDTFNKQHFEQLQQARGPGHKRAVTPKVGEEPLNLVEYQAMQRASPRGFWSAGNTPQGAFSRVPTAAAAAGPAGMAAPAVATPLSAGHVNGAIPAAVPLGRDLLTPPAGYRHRSEVHAMLRDPLPPPTSGHRTPQPSPRYPPVAVWDHQPLSDQAVPRPRPPISPISQYDVMKAQGPDRQRLKAELATELQQTWQRQIEARQEFERAVEVAESVWPYNLVNVPNDKRPVHAISRPPTSPIRGTDYQ